MIQMGSEDSHKSQQISHHLTIFNLLALLALLELLELLELPSLLVLAALPSNPLASLLCAAAVYFFAPVVTVSRLCWAAACWASFLSAVADGLADGAALDGGRPAAEGEPRSLLRLVQETAEGLSTRLGATARLFVVDDGANGTGSRLAGNCLASVSARLRAILTDSRRGLLSTGRSCCGCRRALAIMEGDGGGWGGLAWRTAESSVAEHSRAAETGRQLSMAGRAWKACASVCDWWSPSVCRWTAALCAHWVRLWQ